MYERGFMFLHPYNTLGASLMVKAVILAAGETKTGGYYRFPENSKPKCLFHVKGKTILDVVATSLRDAGIDDIRVVTGYHSEDIEAYNEENHLELEIVFNPDWAESAPSSLFTGLRDVKDDVLIMFSDIIFDTDIIQSFLRCPEPLVWLTVERPPRLRTYPECQGKSVDIVKVAKEKLGIFEGIDTLVMIEKFGWKNIQGNHIAALLYEAFRANGPRGEVLIKRRLLEIDYYRQTDEHKQESMGRH